jgi:hypothetical protein
MSPDTFWLIAMVMAIIVACLGVAMYVVWRMGSDPDRDEHETSWLDR